MSDNFVRIKPSVFDLGGDVGASQKCAGKASKALAVGLVTARGVKPVRDRVRAALASIPAGILASAKPFPCAVS